MIHFPFGQQGRKLLPDGLDEVRWERGHRRTPSLGSFENSPDDRASCARLSSRSIASLSAQALSKLCSCGAGGRPTWVFARMASRLAVVLLLRGHHRLLLYALQPN